MGSAARQSAFVEELLDDEEYGVEKEHEAFAEPQTCGDCQGHLFPVPKQDGGMY
ncbi:hypothetical protein [Ruegeria sp. HKCCA5426]|nr:hypothetical protein [Ruegeria sp. HKCCA5426]